jgi:hypothetical protein
MQSLVDGCSSLKRPVRNLAISDDFGYLPLDGVNSIRLTIKSGAVQRLTTNDQGSN